MAININNTRFYIENFLWIRTKETKLKKLKLNPAQEKYYNAVAKLRRQGKPVRIIILKARQLGFSTLTEAMIFKRTATRRNVQSLVVAHREDSTANLFRMTKLFYDKLPPELRPMLAGSNAQELYFANPSKDPAKRLKNPGLNSRIRCNTAGGGGIGRSDTLENVHASEFAFWRGNKLETYIGIAQAVPALPGTMIVIESTANGFDEFKKLWDDAVAGLNDFLPLFFAWFENPEYSMPVPPGTEWTEGELELREQFGLTEEQLSWRRWCIKNNCAGDERKFRQEYPATPEEAFLTTGRGVFNNEAVMSRLRLAPEPLRVGEFAYDYDGLLITNIRWVDKPDGCVAIYREPKRRRHYVLGGDTAGEGSDWFTGWVIDNNDCGQAARLRKQYGEAEYARQIYCLGMYYNQALVGIETNFSTYPTMELARLGYPRLYVRERPDTYTGKVMESYGYRTTNVTRPAMIAGLVEMFDQHPELFTDRETLKEMLTFVYNEEGRPEAIEGEHDDLIFGLGIAYAIRGQQAVSDGAEKYTMDGWIQDMLEDYQRGDEAERAYMLKAWGRPVQEEESNG